MLKLLATDAATAVIIIRLLVGAVFVSEGIQKFLFPAEVGAGRFKKIGIRSPEFVAPIAAAFGIACGPLVAGGLTRNAHVGAEA